MGNGEIHGKIMEKLENPGENSGKFMVKRENPGEVHGKTEKSMGKSMEN